MSTQPDGNSAREDLSHLFEKPAAAADGRRVRSASVTFREADAATDDPAALMDPAARSLADALRITFRLLQLAMVVLLVLFIFSGSKTVDIGERGIRVIRGKPSDTDLSPGFHWSLPYPLGELIKIPTAPPSIAMEEAFYPFLTPEQKGKSTEQLIQEGWGDSLSPERDGSLLTAEGHLAHVKCVVKYRRENPKLVHESILPGDNESKIVQAAVRRGIIHAAAMLTSDELLTGNPDPSRPAGEFRSAEEIAREVAESQLRDLGIEIDQLSLIDAIPPLGVARDYGKPQEAQAAAKNEINRAINERRAKLAAVAGPAADTILEQIDRYEEQLKLGQMDEARATEQRIAKLLQGEPVEIDGVTVNPRIEGQVPAMLAAARQEKAATVALAQKDAQVFAAIRESYRTNPAVVLNTQWTDAFAQFLRQPNVQVQLLAPGERWVLHINRDPEFTRQQEFERRKKENEEYEKERNRQRMLDHFRRSADPDRNLITSE